MTFFQKRLTHGFDPKMTIFPTFFSGNIGQENVVFDIVERKNPFLRYQKKEVQKVEKLTFLQKGLTHGFGPKTAIFSTFYFKQ